MEIIERVSLAEMKRIYGIVQRALKDGTLVKPKVCSWCGAEGRRIHGHHPDYARPLMVVWICNSCHSRHTKQYDLEWHLFDAVRE